MRFLPVVLLLALSGCSETGLSADPDGNVPDDTDTTGGTDGDTDGEPDACEGTDADPIDVGLNDDCDRGIQDGTFTPVVEWQIDGLNGFGPPAVGQLDDDTGDGVIDSRDTPEICYVRGDRRGVLCLDGSTGAVDLESDGGLGSIDAWSGIAMADLDADGDTELIVGNGPSEVLVMDHTGALVWRRGGLSQTHSYFTYPSVADLDADGEPEVIYGRHILSSTGTVVGSGTRGTGSVPNAGGSLSEGSVPLPIDLDGDGELEVVVGNAAYRKDGSIKYQNSLPDGNVAAADFDLDGLPELVVVSGNTVRTLESDLQPTGWSDSFGGNYVGPAAIDDLDGDGIPDFVVVSANAMRAYAWDGALLWSATVQDRSGAAGPILFDFEMDGYPEVVFADEVAVRVFNGLDGRVKLESFEHASPTGFETPVVADVDNDDQVEIVMLHATYGKGLTVFGDADSSWPPGRQIWNQHAYSITNINDDLSVPMGQEPNWARYNNFRSADAGRPPNTWDDVRVEVVDICTDDCPDALYVQVQVWNQGTEEIPAGLPVAVRAGEGGPILQVERLPAPIPSERSSPGLTLRIDAAVLAGRMPIVEVDIDEGGFSSLAECDEINNAILVTETCE